MYYKKLRDIYREYESGPTHKKIAQILGTSEYYARKCLRTGCFTIQDKRKILNDLGIDDKKRAEEIFPILG